MKKWLRKFQRGVRYRVTGGGFLFSLAVTLIGAAALASANNLLFLILATMVSVLLISGLVSRLGLAGLELDFVLPEHVSAGRPVAATLAVRNVKLWMPSFSVHVAGAAEPGIATPPILDLRGLLPAHSGPRDDRRDRRASILPPRRVPAESIHLQYAFPIRVFRRPLRYRCAATWSSIRPSIPNTASKTCSARSAAISMPTSGAVATSSIWCGPMSRSKAPRYLDWKATAHTGNLQVREFAHEQERAVEIYLDCAISAGDEPWFEEAVDCCAFLAWRLSQQGAAIRFQSANFSLRSPEESDVYTLLEYLALVQPVPASTPAPPLDEQSFQIVFSREPTALEGAGWTPARLLRPGDPALAGDGPGTAG